MSILNQEPGNSAATPATGVEGKTLASSSSGGAASGRAFWTAIAVGSVLAAAGTVTLAVRPFSPTYSLLILCSGLGLIFGAFGATATIQYKGIVIAGVAAVAITLLVTVHHLMLDQFVKLVVAGDVEDADVTIQNRDSSYGRLNEDIWEFVVFASEIRRDDLRITVRTKPETEAEQAYIFKCVGTRDLEGLLGSDQELVWYFDKEKSELRTANKTIAVGGCAGADTDDLTDAAGTSLNRWASPLSVRPARADRPISETRVRRLLESLESDSSIERRNARDDLARLGPGVSKYLLDHLAGNSKSYRIRLGVVVAFAKMLRSDERFRKDIIKAMDDDDVERFISASTSDDRVLRNSASEFLFDLGDPRAAILALKELSDIDGGDKDAKVATASLLLVVQGAMPFADGETSQEIVRELNRLKRNPKTTLDTRRFIEQILSAKSG